MEKSWGGRYCSISNDWSTLVWLSRLNVIESNRTYPCCTKRFWMAYRVAGKAATLKLSSKVQSLRTLDREFVGSVIIDENAIIIFPNSVPITTEVFEISDDVNRLATIGCKPNWKARRMQYINACVESDGAVVIILNPPEIWKSLAGWSDWTWSDSLNVISFERRVAPPFLLLSLVCSPSLKRWVKANQQHHFRDDAVQEWSYLMHSRSRQPLVSWWHQGVSRTYAYRVTQICMRTAAYIIDLRFSALPVLSWCRIFCCSKIINHKLMQHLLFESTPQHDEESLKIFCF